MRTDACREWREALGAYALGQLAEDERAAVAAHLDGCDACRNELGQLAALARPLSLADPERFDAIPKPPVSLAARVAATIARERLRSRRRRIRLGVALAGAAVAATLLAVFALSGGGSSVPEQQVRFASLPKGMEITAALIPHSYGTEIHMYVSGVRSGTLCRVYLRGHAGRSVSAGSFRYRWSEEGEDAVLSSALDLSEARAVEIRVGGRTFEQEVRQ